MQGKFYPLRNDIVFKVVFGKEGNEPLLACLIEAVLGLEGERRIRELTLLSPLNLQQWKDDKFTLVDVKAVDHCNRRFSIEMQVRDHPNFEKRMAYYLALLYAGQLHSGDDYEKLFPAYSIAILDYILFHEHDRLQSAFAFREASSGALLPDLLELHFIELPKYHDRPRSLRSRLEKWLYVLRFGELFAADEPLPEHLATDKELAMAVRELRRINADEQMRAILEQREKDEHDRISDLNAARKAGIDEGRKTGIDEGRQEGIHEVVRAMLNDNQDPEFIARMTGLSVEEIRLIRRVPQ